MSDAIDNIADMARRFAVRAHGEQKYGDNPYSYHLSLVEDVLTDFHYATDTWRAAAWLHDVVEDTEWGIEYIHDLFGGDVAALVWAVTGIGKNRKERNANIYSKIERYPQAAILKCADRIVNVEMTMRDNHPSHGEMYRKEMPRFAEVVKPHVPDVMWARLEHAIEQL